MENKIKVGEYVRTNEGIIDKVDRYSIGSCVYHCKNGMCIDECETVGIPISDIKKHSFNIIDLIEMGDILKYRLNDFSSIDVSEVILVTEGRTLKDYLSVKGYSLNQIENLSLITKEQFKNVEYEVKNHVQILYGKRKWHHKRKRF